LTVKTRPNELEILERFFVLEEHEVGRHRRAGNLQSKSRLSECSA
jgi:hypothetical protein